MKRIVDGELRAGSVLPWSVFDTTGRLLLREGHLLADNAAVEALLNREVCRMLTDEELNGDRAAAAAKRLDPFVVLPKETAGLARGLANLAGTQEPEAADWILPMVEVIEELGGMHVDAVLGALLLMDELPYSMAHTWMVATLCELMARRIVLPDLERRSLVAAALTCNVGMLQVQDTLSSQPGAMTPEQDAIVKQHPVRSRQLLGAAGVRDPYWLTAVLQHHERLDGSGYPRGLRDTAIGIHARLIALCDTYAAMILPRAYRDGLHAKEALREIFLQRGSRIDEELAMIFIKELGVFPPGVFVKLANGETAVVVRRNPKHANKPLIVSLLTPWGKPLERPLLRECAEASPYAITGVLPRMPLPFSHAQVWGYRA